MTTQYYVPDVEQIMTREEIIAEYMAEAGYPHDRTRAEQALEHAVELGILQPIVADANGGLN